MISDPRKSMHAYQLCQTYMEERQRERCGDMDGKDDSTGICYEMEEWL